MGRIYIASYSAISVANTFLELVEDEKRKLDPVRLMKLVYVAHGVALAISKGSGILVRERFEAGEYGPVVPSLYRACVKYGSGKITAPLISSDVPSLAISRSNEDSRGVVEVVHEKYGALSHAQLIALVTRESLPEGYPWHEAWVLRDGQHRPGTDLSDEVMAESFSKIIASSPAP